MEIFHGFNDWKTIVNIYYFVLGITLTMKNIGKEFECSKIGITGIILWAAMKLRDI